MSKYDHILGNNYLKEVITDGTCHRKYKMNSFRKPREINSYLGKPR